MKPGEMQVHTTTALRVLGALTLVAMPHIVNVRKWTVAVLALLIAWRTLCLVRGWRLPPAWVRITLVVFAFMGVMNTYGRINGQTAGVSLLLLMVGLKLTEARTRRDWEIVLILTYFLLITHFLFSQSLFMLGFLLLCVAVTTTALADLSHRQSAMPIRQAFRASGKVMLHALPVMAILFVLFPRIPGPLWGLPADAGAARSGLSDTMQPGSIGDLIQSEAVVFRVRFDGQPPPKKQLYWRAHVFSSFDGLSWRDGMPNGGDRPALQSKGERVSYEVTLEPHRQPWLFGLDIVETGPRDALFSRNHQMWSKEPVKERRLYQASSIITDTVEEPLDWITQRRSLKLPEDSNPRARELGASWASSGQSADRVVNAALLHFRENPFRYTLQPPLLGADPVDQFLFRTRAGFCEHYASAFVVLMRAAGIPARVVTGYQGGELNDLSDYMIVRQSDAHAWAEVWIENRGWVRVDPTGAVAPERVELGLSAALSEDDMPLAFASRTNFRYFIEMNWDLVNASWNRWVLAYGPELQKSFLSRFGLFDWYRMTLALTALIVIVLTILGLSLIRQARPARELDAVQKIWLQACNKLEKMGIPRLPHEGPRDYASRVGQQNPHLRKPFKDIAARYIELRYSRGADCPDSEKTQDLKKAVARFKTAAG